MLYREFAQPLCAKAKATSDNMATQLSWRFVIKYRLEEIPRRGDYRPLPPAAKAEFPRSAAACIAIVVAGDAA